MRAGGSLLGGLTARVGPMARHSGSATTGHSHGGPGGPQGREHRQRGDNVQAGLGQESHHHTVSPSPCTRQPNLSTTPAHSLSRDRVTSSKAVRTRLQRNRIQRRSRLCRLQWTGARRPATRTDGDPACRRASRESADCSGLRPYGCPAVSGCHPLCRRICPGRPFLLQRPTAFLGSAATRNPSQTRRIRFSHQMQDRVILRHWTLTGCLPPGLRGPRTNCHSSTHSDCPSSKSGRLRPPSLRGSRANCHRRRPYLPRPV